MKSEEVEVLLSALSKSRMLDSPEKRDTLVAQLTEAGISWEYTPEGVSWSRA